MGKTETGKSKYIHGNLNNKTWNNTNNIRNTLLILNISYIIISKMGTLILISFTWLMFDKNFSGSSDPTVSRKLLPKWIYYLAKYIHTKKNFFLI